MRFYSFGNSQTYQFFWWALHSGKVPVDSLIDRAWEKIETGEDNTADGKLWHEMGVDASTCLRDELAGLLEEIADEAFARFTNCAPDPLVWVSIAEGPGPEEYDSEEGAYGTPKSMKSLDVDHLFVPILVDALRQIQFETVAEAILIAKGKWSPDRKRYLLPPNAADKSP